VKWGRAIRVTSYRSGATWASGRGDMIIYVIGYWFTGGGVERGPLGLVKDTVNKVFCAGIAGRHADVEFIEGYDKFIKVRNGGMG
jgi:hypothetical protein